MGSTLGNHLTNGSVHTGATKHVGAMLAGVAHWMQFVRTPGSRAWVRTRYLTPWSELVVEREHAGEKGRSHDLVFR